MIPVRQLIVDVVRTQLCRIKTANGFLTDAGIEVKKVNEWRDLQGEAMDAVEMPCITFRDTNEEMSAISATVHEFNLTLEVAAFDSSGDQTPARMRQLDADLKKCLGLIKATLKTDGLAFYLQPLQGVPDVKTSGKKFGGVRITADIKYRTPAFDPFTPHTAPV